MMTNRRVLRQMEQFASDYLNLKENIKGSPGDLFIRFQKNPKRETKNNIAVSSA